MKNKWPLGIVVVILLFMVFILTLVVKTYQLKVDLVSENYYEQELSYQKQLVKMNNVSEAERVSWKIMGEEILFRFPLSTDSIVGTIQFFRPSDASLDREMAISVDHQGRQYLSLANLVGGQYRVKIDWQMNQKGYYMEEDIYVP
jgi:hypothetical protein